MPAFERHRLTRVGRWEHASVCCVIAVTTQEVPMGLGKGALLWLLGIPLPIIILLALFWR